jgi:hypothetical protein
MARFELEEESEKLEGKRNRKAKMQKMTIYQLNRKLERTVGTVFRQRLVDSLNKKFKHVYSLREKS